MTLVNTVFVCVGTAAETGMVISGIVLAIKPRASRFIRFAPLANLTAWLACGIVYFLVEGVSSFLVIPVCCFGIFIGVRLLFFRSVLNYMHAVCSFVFWPSLLLEACRYLVLVYFRP